MYIDTCHAIAGTTYALTNTFRERRPNISWRSVTHTHTHTHTYTHTHTHTHTYIQGVPLPPGTLAHFY